MKLNKQYLMGLIANIMLLIGFILTLLWPDDRGVIHWIGAAITIISTLMAITLYVRMTMGHIGHDKEEDNDKNRSKNG